MTKRPAKRNGKQEKPKLPDKLIVTIGDRVFKPVGEKRSFEQDIHMMHLLEKMGMNDIHPREISRKNLQRESLKIITQAYSHGVLFEMLGTALVEESKEEEWNTEVAVEVGDIFRYTTDSKARTALETNMVLLLMDFFTSALASTGISPSFSVELPVGETLAESGEEFSNSEIGTPSSERLRKAIQIAEERLQSGQ